MVYCNRWRIPITQLMNARNKKVMKMKNTVKSLCAATLMSAVSMIVPTTGYAGDQPFVGETMAFGGNFCPRGWAKMDGQLLAVSSNDALFSLIGSIYGGDGRTTFGLPDLRARVPVHAGTGPGLAEKRIGAKSGAPTTALIQTQLAPHNHLVNAANNQGNKFGPGGDFLGDPNTQINNTDVKIYSDADANRVMAAGMIGNTGGGTAFSIASPFLTVTWCIAMYGVYPSRN
jgi:microcystin-dependent protein